MRCAVRSVTACSAAIAIITGLVASGHLDLVVESWLKIHDWAALVPVVTGAGGVMTDWAGAPLRQGSDGRVIAAGDARVAEAVTAYLSP